MTLEFPQHNDCTLCDLHEQCKSVAVPTRLASLKSHDCTKAVLIIGEAPGFQEDKANKSWVGWSGNLLHQLLSESYHLNQHADIYLANTCRCRPPANTKPTKKQRTACRPYLLDDIRQLAKAYGPDNLYLLCLGGPAVDTIAGTSIKKSLASQGQRLVPKDMTETLALRTFCSYHPAYFTPGRSPESIHAFDAHLNLLLKAVTDDEPSPPETINPLRAPSSIIASVTAPVISLDIETYGILRSMPDQTVFHPRRSEEVDGVPRAHQVISCSLAWHSFDSISTAFYNLGDRQEQANFIACLTELGGSILTGTNLTFDIVYLRACFPRLALLLRPEAFAIDDITVLNHLHSDGRPERSLKALSHLFGTADYHSLKVSTLPTGQKAASPTDPNLMYYGCTDAISTLKIYDLLQEELQARWGPSPVDRAWFRSDLMWTTIHMTEHGITFDLPALIRTQSLAQQRRTKAFEEGGQAGYTFGGKGSVLSLRTLFTQALTSAELLDDKRVEFTKKQKLVSYGANNVYLLLSLLPIDDPYRPIIESYNRYAQTASIHDSYLTPLLTKPRKGCINNGEAFPSWYPVPAYVKDTNGGEGGTRQGRFAAHKPAAQTFPSEVKACLRSRYPQGLLLSYDLSQIELRVAAILSGDPNMCAVYAQPDLDLHVEAARLIWPDYDEVPASQASRRQMAKQVNFLTLYRGGPHKLVSTVRRKLGEEISPVFAKQVIGAFWKGRGGLRAWQDGLIAQATRDGYLELATGWRRTFVKSKEAIDATYINEICNFSVQTWAAQIAQSVQADIIHFRYSGPPKHRAFVMPAQTHDDILIDTTPEIAATVDRMVSRSMAAPPLWGVLCQSVERTFPMAFERKVLAGDPRWLNQP